MVCDHLGFHINFEYAGNYFVKAPNGTMLEIIPSEGERTPQAMKSPGIRHLAIAVDSFDAAHEDLKAKSVNFLTELSPPRETAWSSFPTPTGTSLT